MGRSPLFESFDGPLQAGAPFVPSEDWQDGYQAGLADGLAQANAQQDALSEVVVQHMLDLGFQFAEARAQVLAGLRPLFAALSDRLLPALGQAAFGAHLAEALAAAALADMTRPVRIAVHPDQVAAMTVCLAGQASAAFAIIADLSLSPGQALINSATTATMIDIDGLIAAASDALLALTEAPPPRRSEHG